MKKSVIGLLAGLTSIGTAGAQTPPDQQVPATFHGKWAPTLRACTQDPDRSGAADMNGTGYTSSNGNAAVLRRGRVVNGVHYFDVIFSADGDRQWPGRLAIRRTARGLALSAIAQGSTRNWSLVRCPR